MIFVLSLTCGIRAQILRMEVKIRAFLAAGMRGGEVMGRSSATGSPRRSITIMPPSEASRTNSEVWMWSSRTDVFLIKLHCSTWLPVEYVSNSCGPTGTMLEPGNAEGFQTDRGGTPLRSAIGPQVWTDLEPAFIRKLATNAQQVREGLRQIDSVSLRHPSQASVAKAIPAW